MDLSTMYEEDTEFTDTFVEGALDEVTYNGKIYGAPTDITCMTVWYNNKKIFEENNVSVPKTYEELKEVIAKLEEKWGNSDRSRRKRQMAVPRMVFLSGTENRRSGTLQ